MQCTWRMVLPFADMTGFNGGRPSAGLARYDLGLRHDQS